MKAVSEENEQAFDDDASFVTARSSPEQEEGKESLEIAPKHGTHLESIKRVTDDTDNDVASVLTVEQEDSPGAPKPTESLVDATRFVPRAMPVNKIMVQLQLHVSDLIRPRKTETRLRLNKNFLPFSRITNPYYRVELLQPETDVSMVLHESEPVFGRREAVWQPLRFTVDANAAQSMGMVLRFSILHKRLGKNERKEDKLVGSHQASLWDLEESLEQIPLKGRDHRITGLMRLVSYHMEAVDGCLRIDI